MTAAAGTGPLRATHEVAFSYRRSVGGAVGAFLAGLARGEILAARRADGRLVVPPGDADPVEDLVPVTPVGTVRSWTWVDDPPPGAPLDRPFGYALIELDGADTCLLHLVDMDGADVRGAGGPGPLRTGLRVRADWRAERTGSIRDIRAFVPGDRAAVPAPADPPEELAVVTDVHLRYHFEPGLVSSAFLRALGQRRITGGRCPSCAAVYVPPRPRCPACGGSPMQTTEVGDVGTIVSYAVVRVPPPGPPRELPFAWAQIRLDGVDVPFPHLLGEIDVADVRVGDRVQAVWVDDAQLAPTWASIRHFRPVDR